MFIIDRSGKRHNLSKEADFHFMQNATVLDEDVELVDEWNAYFNKYNHETGIFDFVSEKRYDHEPTNDELLYEMGKLGLGYGDYVDISKIKTLKWTD